MEQDNVIQFPTPKELTPEQREYWERALANAERAREYAQRMLGVRALGLVESDGHL